MYRLKKLLRKFKFGIHREVFYEYDLSRVLEIPQVKNIPQIKILDKQNIEDIFKIWNVDRGQIRKRMESSDSVCFLSYLNSEPVAYHWLQVAGNHYVQKGDFSFTIRQGKTAMIYHTRVDRTFHGKGINTFVMWHIINYCREKGLDKLWIYTASDNHAQRKSLDKLGFEFIKSVSSIFVGKKYFVLTKF